MRQADKLYDRLIRPIEKQMKGIVGRIVRDSEDAEDVFQNVLSQIWSKLEKIDRHPNPHAYILRICVTRSYDALKKKARRRRYEVFLETVKAKLLPDYSGHSDTTHDRKVILREAIAMLPPKQGRVVLLRLMDETPYPVIGNILGCSEATARSHFSKAKDKLVKIFRAMDNQH